MILPNYRLFVFTTLSILLGGFIVCAFGATVLAQRINIDDILTVPSFADEFPIERFFAESDLFEEKRPHGDPHLAYRLRMPQGWTKVDDAYVYDTEEEAQPIRPTVFTPRRASRRGSQPAPETSEPEQQVRLSQRLLEKVATYYGPFRMDATSRFEIYAMRLEHEITAKNWFLQHVLSNGYVLQGMREHADNKVEGLYVLVERDDSYYVRSIVEINGPRLTVVSYFLPEAYWREERALQEHVVRAFRFTQPEQTRAESVRTFSFLNMVNFDYPQSWRLSAPSVYSVEGMDARLLYTSDQRTLSGEINLHIVSTELDTTLAQEVQFIKEDISEKNLIIGNLIEEPKGFDLHNHIYFSRVEVYHVNNRGGTLVDYEYWLAVMAESRYYYLLTMLTPGRNADFYTWARNTESFETVIKSLRPGDGEPVGGRAQGAAVQAR